MAVKMAARPPVAFAHPSEAEIAKILDFYRVRWEYEPRSFEDAIDNVRLLLDAVVSHLAFAVRAQHDKNGSLGILDLRPHLDVGLCAVVKDSQRP